MNVRFGPSGPLRGRVRVPADKSISHRAAIIAAMGSEPVRVRNYLDAAGHELDPGRRPRGRRESSIDASASS